jgi:hypothetical protein
MPVVASDLLSKVRFENNYVSPVVFHGGRDFDQFDVGMNGKGAGGVRTAYFWFTSEFDNACYFEDGAIHEGKLHFDRVAILDVADVGMSACAICDEIFISLYESGGELPTGFVLHNCFDGCRRSTIYAACHWSGDDEPAFRRAAKHTIGKNLKFVRKPSR